MTTTLKPNSTNCTGYTSSASSLGSPDALATILAAATELDGTQKNTVSTDDANGVNTSGSAAAFLARYRVSGTPSQIDVVMKAVDSGPAESTIYLYVWNATDTAWELLDSEAPGTVTLTGSLTTGLAEYVDGSGDVHVLIVAGNSFSHTFTWRYGEIAVTIPDTVPGAPTASFIGTFENTITPTWIAPADTGGQPLIGYQVDRRSPSGSGSYTTIVADTGSTATSYADTGLDFSTSYGYRIAAINSIGVGPFSSEMTATTDEAPPSFTSSNTPPVGLPGIGLGFD